MSPWVFGFVVGAVFCGLPAGVMAVFTYQWVKEGARWRRRDSFDPSIERLRALSQPQPKKPSPVISDRPLRRVP